MRRGLVLAALLPFAAAGQELADERAAAAYAAWTDDTAARLAARGTVHDALAAILFEQAAAKGGRSRAPERSGVSAPTVTFWISPVARWSKRVACSVNSSPT